MNTSVLSSSTKDNPTDIVMCINGSVNFGDTMVLSVWDGWDVISKERLYRACTAAEATRICQDLIRENNWKFEPVKRNS